MKHGLEVPAPPRYAEAVLGSGLELLCRYAESLASDGVTRGLIGPREVPRLWDRHLLNCHTLVAQIGEGASVCDLGSGAGLPGLVVARCRPDLEVTLVEPLLRRSTYLHEVSEALNLANVTIVRGRADSLHRTHSFDVVTSRALAPMSRLLEWSMPLVSDRGSLLAMKGASVAEELAEATEVLAGFGCRKPELLTLTQADGVSTTTVVRVSWSSIRKVSWTSQSVKMASSSLGKGSSPRSKNNRRRRSSGNSA